MAAYKLTNGGVMFTRIVPVDDEGATETWSSFIPDSPGNSHWQRYLEWVAAGNTPDPADPPPIKYGGTIPITERRVQTIGTTPVEIFRHSVPANTGYIADLKLVGIADDLSLRVVKATIVIGRGATNVAIVQNASGQDQTVVANHRSNATAGGWTVTPSVDNTAPGGVQRRDYVITVTGSTNRTINWRLTGVVESFTPGGE